MNQPINCDLPAEQKTHGATCKEMGAFRGLGDPIVIEVARAVKPRAILNVHMSVDPLVNDSRANL